MVVIALPKCFQKLNDKLFNAFDFITNNTCEDVSQVLLC